MEIIIIVILLVGAILIFLGVRQSRQPDTLEERLEQFGTLERPPSLEEIEMSQPFAERIMLPVLRGIARFVSRFTPRQSMESVQHQLDLAGNPYNWGPMEYLGVRAVAFVLFAALAGFVFVAGRLPGSRRFLVTGAAVAAGIVLPAAFKFPALYKQLIGAGYTDVQIPTWIYRPDSHLPPEEHPEATLDAEEDLKAPEELPSTSGTFKDLPTLADLKVPVETPPNRTVELKAPEAPEDLKHLKDLKAPEDLKHLKAPARAPLRQGMYTQGGTAG